MGIFDRWRRKKEHNIRSTVHAREIMWTEPRPSKHLKTRISTHSTPVVEGEIKSLLAKRDELAKRRKELQQERNELTRHLDNGEISP